MLVCKRPYDLLHYRLYTSIRVTWSHPTVSLSVLLFKSPQMGHQKIKKPRSGHAGYFKRQMDVFVDTFIFVGEGLRE